VRGACNRPAVTSTPPSSPKPTVERADRHAGGVQPHHGDAPLRLRRIQHGGPGPHVMKPARRLLRAKNCTATCANAAPSRLRNRCRDSRQPCAWPNSANRAHRSRVSQPREEARRSIWPKGADSNGGSRRAEGAVKSSAGSSPLLEQQGSLLPRHEDDAPVFRPLNGSHNDCPVNHPSRRINFAAGQATPLAGEAGDVSPPP
jgi:hypothetical protein